MALTAHASAYTGDVNDWALKEVTIGPIAAAAFTGTVPLLTLAETCDIEKITMRWSAASTSGTALFRAAASGTAPASGTALTGAELTSGTIDTPVDLSFASGSPQINLASGTVIAFTAGGTATNLVGLMITIVLRKSPARRDNTSDTTKVDKTKYGYTKN
jgi:hypothetical protein